MQLAPARGSAGRTETLPPAEPYLIEEVTLVPPLERELPDEHQESNPPSWAPDQEGGISGVDDLGQGGNDSLQGWAEEAKKNP
jgi:hypothetical protein